MTLLRPENRDCRQTVLVARSETTPRRGRRRRGPQSHRLAIGAPVRGRCPLRLPTSSRGLLCASGGIHEDRTGRASARIATFRRAPRSHCVAIGDPATRSSTRRGGHLTSGTVFLPRPGQPRGPVGPEFASRPGNPPASTGRPHIRRSVERAQPRRGAAGRPRRAVSVAWCIPSVARPPRRCGTRGFALPIRRPGWPFRWMRSPPEAGGPLRHFARKVSHTKM